MASTSTSARKSLWDPKEPMPASSTLDEPAPERETRRILRTAYEIHSSADATLEELDRQGKKISNAQDGIARINDKLTSSERMIYELGSFWGSIVSRFRSEPPKTAHMEAREAWEEEHKNNMESKRGAATRRSSFETPAAPPKPLQSEYLDETDRDLDEIHELVKDMKRKAVLMGETLEEHNTRLDRLSPEIDHTTARIRASRTKVQTLIDKA